VVLQIVGDHFKVSYCHKRRKSFRLLVNPFLSSTECSFFLLSWVLHDYLPSFWVTLFIMWFDSFCNIQTFSAEAAQRESSNWGEMVEIEEGSERTPGHSVHMHEKLSSPSRKRQVSVLHFTQGSFGALEI
jgi:hypothetical protein